MSKQVTLTQSQQDAVVELFHEVNHERHHHKQVTAEMFREALEARYPPVKKRFQWEWPVFFSCFIALFVGNIVMVNDCISREQKNDSLSAIKNEQFIAISDLRRRISFPASAPTSHDSTYKILAKDHRTKQVMKQWKVDKTDVGDYGFIPQMRPLVDTVYFYHLKIGK